MERVRVLLPRSLQAYWQGEGTLEVEGRDLGEVFAAVGRERPALAEHLPPILSVSAGVAGSPDG